MGVEEGNKSQILKSLDLKYGKKKLIEGCWLSKLGGKEINKMDLISKKERNCRADRRKRNIKDSNHNIFF